MNFDLVSDLHIDRWGKINSTEWIQHQASDTLLVAGDTSDFVDITCEYILFLRRYYKTIIVVDGNHEHEGFNYDIKRTSAAWSINIKQTGAYFLGDGAYTSDSIRFIGCNGWWSFDFGLPNVSTADCISSVLNKTRWALEHMDQQFEQGCKDINQLSLDMIDAENNNDIKHIVVLTHTLPHSSCISWNIYPPDSNFVGLYGNSQYMNILTQDDTNQKLRFWCFGHNHDCKNIPYKQARLISNPRGRPEDWNRVDYKPLTLEIKL
jgi:hypothetical protein